MWISRLKLQIEFQDSQGYYIGKPCLKKQNSKTTKQNPLRAGPPVPLTSF